MSVNPASSDAITNSSRKSMGKFKFKNGCKRSILVEAPEALVVIFQKDVFNMALGNQNVKLN